MSLKALFPRVGIVIAALVSAGLLWAAWSLTFPPRHELRPAWQTAQAPIDERTGVYTAAAGGDYLIAPALGEGLLLHPVDRRDASWRINDDQLRGEGVPDTGPLSRRDPQPYSIREVVVSTPDRLAGWLVEPAEAIKGGVVIVHGAGASDRDNGYYVMLAHQFASRGYVVVLPDKRGSGRSEGDWRNASFGQLAGDASVWLDLLRKSSPGLPRYGLVGVSQGGTVAVQAAALTDADFVIALSSSTISLGDTLAHEIDADIRNGGAPAFIRPVLGPLFTFRARRRHPEFWALNGDDSLLRHWQAWRGPLFMVFGTDDEQDNVPVAASVAALEAFPADGKVTWRVHEGVGHSLTGPGGRFAPGLLEALFGWIERQGAGQPPTPSGSQAAPLIPRSRRS